MAVALTRRSGFRASVRTSEPPVGSGSVSEKCADAVPRRQPLRRLTLDRRDSRSSRQRGGDEAVGHGQLVVVVGVQRADRVAGILALRVDQEVLDASLGESLRGLLRAERAPGSTARLVDDSRDQGQLALAAELLDRRRRLGLDLPQRRADQVLLPGGTDAHALPGTLAQLPDCGRVPEGEEVIDSALHDLSRGEATGLAQEVVPVGLQALVVLIVTRGLG